jgi:phosphatidylcholine synthase
MTSPPEPDSETPSATQTAVAWLVHAFTATGAILALLALLAVEAKQWSLALLWLLIALAVDGIDGSLARWAKVRQRASRVDGDTLDLVIDYLTYVFVPTMFLWHAGLLPSGYELWLAAAIQLSSLYLFARTDMKTQDGYFRGFPSLWNLVAFYLFVLHAGPVTVTLVVLLFAALTFAPIHFVHPFRVRDFGRWLPFLATVWAVATCALLWPDLGPQVRLAFTVTSVGLAVLLFSLGLSRTLRSSPEKPVARAH